MDFINSNLQNIIDKENVLKRKYFCEFIKRLNTSLFSFLCEPVITLYNKYGTNYLDECEHHLDLLINAFPDKDGIGWLVDGFIAFNKEVLKEELYFENEGTYRYSKEQNNLVIDMVYSNEEVMNSWYLVGLYLSYLFWPHHYKILNYFKNSIKSEFTSVKSISEWGVGHGLFSLTAIKEITNADLSIYDISQHSLDFSQKILNDSEVSIKDITLCNVLEAEIPSFDMIICGELLEHVTDPEFLIRKLSATLTKSGKAFITAAINAPQTDHISHFKDVCIVETMINDANLNIISSDIFIHPSRENQTNPPLIWCAVVENIKEIIKS